MKQLDTTPTSLEAILLELSEASWAIHMRKDLAVLQQEALAAIEALIPEERNQQLPGTDSDEQRCRFYRDGGFNFAVRQMHRNFKGRPEAGEGE